MKYYTVTSEWDIGLEGKRFSTIEVARAHVELAFVETGMEDITVAEAEDEGLISYNEEDVAGVITTLPHRYTITKEDVNDEE